MEGVRRMVLADICPGLDNALIVGIIIATQDARTITVKKDMSKRGVWNFTLRDSVADFINATMWGSVDFVNSNAARFHVGDIVSVTNAQIAFRNTGGSDENFRPVVSSPFQLTLSEVSSEMQHHTLPDAVQFQPLLHIPTKQSLDIITLTDVNSNGEFMQGSFVNLLVAIKSVQQVRQILTQDKRQIECREVIVFDQTCTGLTLQLWDSETIKMASQWKSRETVLFLADMRLKWNMYRHSAVPTVNSKTVITPDPVTPEAECLRVYARAALLMPTAIIDHLASNIVDVNSIKNVLSVRAVLSRSCVDINSHQQSEDEQQFTALVYAVLTYLDLDHENLVITKCSTCNKPVEEQNVMMCNNTECAVGQGVEHFNPRRCFNIRVDLSDHTGTLKNCRLNAEAAESVLGCSVHQFDAMTADQRTQLKWSFLMEHCAARIVILKATHQRRQPLVSVVSCSIADLSEVSSRLPVL